jgi:DNA-binding response OmpR family regulator
VADGESPRHLSADAKTGGRTLVVDPPKIAAGHRPRVLIVEDNVRYAFELMRVFKDSLQQNVGDVDIASNVQQALVHVDRDDVDIYVVDLRLPLGESDPKERVESGKALVRRIIEKSNAGIIIHSSIPIGADAEELLKLGADDYLEKGVGPEIVRLKIEAVWRRIIMSRSGNTAHFVHANRAFRVGSWRFTIGNRELTTETGKTVRLSPTEHAFLGHLCTAENHEIDRREFNVGVLGRPAFHEDQRIDNLVYRIREKLDGNIQLISKRDGLYRLMNVTELRTKQA